MRIRYIEEYPGYVESGRMGPWIFTLEKPFVFKTEFKGNTFISRWLRIYPSGTIVISEGYSWDGCSPKLAICKKHIIGTPDGKRCRKTGKPKTFYASVAHDALYQYYSWHRIPRKKIDKLFYELMKKSNFELGWLYYFVIRKIGWMFVKRKYEKLKNIKFKK